MDELLRKRIDRALDGLPDDKAYQVLDYLEFIASKYNVGAIRSPIQKIADTVEDTLRAARVPAAAIKGTVGVVDAAGRMMRGLAAAGEAVVQELGRGAGDAKGTPPAEPATGAPPAAPRSPSEGTGGP